MTFFVQSNRMQKQLQAKYELEAVSYDDLKPGDRILIGFETSPSGKKSAEFGTITDKKSTMIPPKYYPTHDEEARFEKKITIKDSKGVTWDSKKKSIMKKTTFE